MEKLMRKVESMDEEERKKMRKLLKEKDEDEDKMGWMYKKDKPDSEDYLLGRRIDKYVEEEAQPSNDQSGRSQVTKSN